jgi:hypothetical protein
MKAQGWPILTIGQKTGLGLAHPDHRTKKQAHARPGGMVGSGLAWEFWAGPGQAAPGQVYLNMTSVSPRSTYMWFLSH